MDILTSTEKEAIAKEIKDAIGNLIRGCETLDMDLAFDIFLDSPDFLMIGPFRKNVPYSNPDVAVQRLYVEGDLSGNGLTDCVCVFRISKTSDIAFVIVFIQEKENQYYHHILPIWTTWRNVYLSESTVGEIKKKCISRSKYNLSLSESYPIPDNRFGVWVHSVAGSSHGFYISSKGPRIIKYGC